MGFFGDLIGDVTSVVTAPIKAITGAISGGASKVIAPIAKVATTAMGDVTGLGKSAIQTAGQTVSGISSAADGMVSHVLTPLSSGLGSGISSLGGGIGGAVKDVGDGFGGMMEYLPIVAGVGVVGFLIMENSDKKRGGEGYINPIMKKFKPN